MIKSISNHTDLSNDKVEEILSNYNLELSGLVVIYLSYKKTGYGHWELSVDLATQKNWSNSICLTRTTTNSNMIDDWNETSEYFLGGYGHWYDNNNAVMEAAFDFILESEHNQELLSEFIENN